MKMINRPQTAKPLYQRPQASNTSLYITSSSAIGNRGRPTSALIRNHQNFGVCNYSNYKSGCKLYDDLAKHSIHGRENRTWYVEEQILQCLTLSPCLLSLEICYFLYLYQYAYVEYYIPNIALYNKVLQNLSSSISFDKKP